MTTTPSSSSAASGVQISSLFLTVFEDHQGQSMLWQRDVLERPLHGAEFSSLPSGLHLVNNDTFYFSYDFPSSNRSEANEEVGAGTGDGEGGLAVVVFRNRAMKEQEIERGDGRGKAKGRGRVMMSLGVVLTPHATLHHSIPPLSALRDLLILCSDTWDLTLPSKEQDKSLIRSLDEFFDVHSAGPIENNLDSQAIGAMNRCRVSEETNESEERKMLFEYGVDPVLSDEHPLRYLPQLPAIFGPNLLTLWKYALAGRRILFYTPPPLHAASQIAWLISLLSALPFLSSLNTNTIKYNEADQADVEAAASTRSGKHHKNPFIGSIGLMDLHKLSSSSSSKKERKGRGYIACTSDGLFRDRPQYWDLFVDFSTLGSVLQDPSDMADMASKGEGFDSQLPIHGSGRTPPTMIASESRPVRNPSSNSTSSTNGPSTISTKAISYSYSDIPTFTQLQLASSSSQSPSSTATSGTTPNPTPNLNSSGALWTILSLGLWRICEVCWGICAYATGSTLLNPDGREHVHSAHGHSHGEGQVHGSGQVGSGIRLEGDEGERILLPESGPGDITGEEYEVRPEQDEAGEEAEEVLGQRDEATQGSDDQKQREQQSEQEGTLKSALRILDVIARRRNDITSVLKRKIDEEMGVYFSSSNSEPFEEDRDGNYNDEETESDIGDDDDDNNETPLTRTSKSSKSKNSRKNLCGPIKITITSSDMKSMSLSSWSSQDVEFVQGLTRRLVREMGMGLREDEEEEEEEEGVVVVVEKGYLKEFLGV